MAQLPGAIADLRRRFKPGYEVERTGGGHYRVRNPEGRLVQYKRKNLTLSGTATGSDVTAMTEALTTAGVLKVPRPRRKLTTTQERHRKERWQAATAERQRNRQKVADALHARMAKVMRNVGGLELPGQQSDLAHVGAMIGQAQAADANGNATAITPDLAANSISRVVHKGWVDPRYQAVWNELADRLEAADDLVDEWFKLVRQARGLPEDVVEVRAPAEGDWPFRVELLPLEAFTVDHDYQRPVPWPFVRKLAQTYDESLVGTIDVSERRHGAIFAILDGQLRYEASKLVGKTTLWASVYSGLDKASEARFFLHKNKDRKAIHPFYTFKARLIAGDEDAQAIEGILTEHGYRLAIAGAREGMEGNISAISAAELAYRRRRPGSARPTLGPTMALLKATTWGMPHGNNAVLIRGISGLFAAFADEEIDPSILEEVMLRMGPVFLLARAREGARGGGSAEYALARVLVTEYNRGLPRAQQLERGRKIGAGTT